MAEEFEFLPISKEDMHRRGWYYYDFLLITGDAYVDHPSFGTAVISRVLEKAGFRVAILSQPDYQNTDDFLAMGRPRYAALINAGNIDSMVAHYSVAKKRRAKDAYTPGGLPGKRPDRAVIVYANRVRQAWGDLPIVIGGIEASLRRFAHYDYWEDKVRRPILVDSAADLLIYGMGEHQITEIAGRLKKGESIQEIHDVRGTCFMAKDPSECAFEAVTEPSFEEVSTDHEAYARAALIEHDEQDFVRGRAILQPCDHRWLVQNPPAKPLETEELDQVADLPYTRTYHPSYEALGGVEAIREVEFSIIHNRGCFGACNFCALTMHQGRYVTSRSHQSVLKEAERMTHVPHFKGYIHDVGGPTANFRGPACKKQAKVGACVDRQCLFPQPCPALNGDHSDYLSLLRKLRQIPGVKKVFIRSGIRYDYMQCDKNGEFFADLVRYHISGQLKVAPEHISPNVLYYMGKPPKEIYERFCEKYQQLNEKYGLEQYLVPYLMSSHPGSRLEDAILLAEYLNATGHRPEQVQDFYPTPGTLSTAMYYTGLDPRTMEPVYVAKDPHEKAMQRALLQWKNPKNRQLVLEALHRAGREDLIGTRKGCLIAEFSPRYPRRGGEKPQNRKEKTAEQPPDTFNGRKGQKNAPAAKKGGKPAQDRSEKQNEKAFGEKGGKPAQDRRKKQGEKAFGENRGKPMQDRREKQGEKAFGENRGKPAQDRREKQGERAFGENRGKPAQDRREKQSEKAFGENRGRSAGKAPQNRPQHQNKKQRKS